MADQVHKRATLRLNHASATSASSEPCHGWVSIVHGPSLHGREQRRNALWAHRSELDDEFPCRDALAEAL